MLFLSLSLQYTAFAKIDIAAVYFWVEFPTNIAFIIECDLKWLFCDLKG